MSDLERRLQASLSPRPAAELLMPEKYLEVGFTPDEREVLVNFPATSIDTAHHVVFSAEQALRFAKLLIRKAMECKR